MLISHREKFLELTFPASSPSQSEELRCLTYSGCLRGEAFGDSDFSVVHLGSILQRSSRLANVNVDVNCLIHILFSFISS